MKFKLIDSKKNIRQIQYLKDIPSRRIKKGDLGGFLQNYGNLSQEGNCVVLKGAVILGDARVINGAVVTDYAILRDCAEARGDAVIGGCATITDFAVIGGCASINDHASIGGHALVKGIANVGDRAYIKDLARIEGHAIITDWAVLKGEALARGSAIIKGTDELTSIAYNRQNMEGFNVTYSIKDKYIRIGCVKHSFEYWSLYVRSGFTKYLDECDDENHHDRCVNFIHNLLEGVKKWTGK